MHRDLFLGTMGILAGVGEHLCSGVMYQRIFPTSQPPSIFSRGTVSLVGVPRMLLYKSVTELSTLHILP